jgi:hypothetical protein
VRWEPRGLGRQRGVRACRKLRTEQGRDLLEVEFPCPRAGSALGAHPHDRGSSRHQPGRAGSTPARPRERNGFYRLRRAYDPRRRGLIGRTPKADEQGVGRLARGKYFHAEAGRSPPHSMRSSIGSSRSCQMSGMIRKEWRSSLRDIFIGMNGGQLGQADSRDNGR